MILKVLPLKKQEIREIAKIASENFSGLKELTKAKKWINCNFNAFPRAQYFVVKSRKKILGYVLWIEKGGFRREAVFELEQIAVKKEFWSQGAGKKLINDSFLRIKKYLKKRNSSLKLIQISTGTKNSAQILYEKTLGAKLECKIKDFYKTDEVIMIARFKKDAEK